MVRDLLASARGAAAAAGFIPPWLAAVFMVAASVWIVSLAVFLCGRSSHSGDDDRIPKKKPAAAKAAKAPKASKPASSGSTAAYVPMYATGALASTSSAGCGGGGGGGGGGQGACCGGGGSSGGGGGGCGGGGGGGCGGGGC